MFNKLTSALTTALVLSGAVMQALGAPTSGDLEVRKESASANAIVCSGVFSTGCVTIPVSSEDCINFTGGLSFLNKEVSLATVPDGLVCTFFEQFSCESAQGGQDTVILQGGTWDFFNVTGPDSNVDFNDLASSFQCSTL